MAVKIRLARGGRKKIARFRIVAADSRSPRDGRFVETLGFYNPQAEPKEFSVNVERIGHWLDNGAELSQTVSNLLRQDRVSDKIEALNKGLTLDSAGVERRPERKRKLKKKPKAAAAA